MSENIELVEELICSHESALHVYKNAREEDKMEKSTRGKVPRLTEINYEVTLRMK